MNILIGVGYRTFLEFMGNHAVMPRLPVILVKDLEHRRAVQMNQIHLFFKSMLICYFEATNN